MQTESLEVLEKADLPSSQARAIVRAIEIEIAGAKDVLATKHDLILLRADLRQEGALLRGEMVELRADLRGELQREVGNLRSELQHEVGNLRSELQHEVGNLRGELKHESGSLRGEFGNLRGELGNLRGELRAEIHASASSISRQMYAALLGQMAVLLGIAYFFVTHLAG